MTYKMFRLNILLILTTSIYGQDGPIVDTNVGQIRGLVKEDFTAFLGIPYGKVDERNPFAPATAYPIFRTPYQAYHDPIVCPQVRLNGTIQGDIHCLHLNIFTPTDTPQNSSLPVMVYVHGGGYVEGNGNLGTYSPKFFIKHDVIFVTVNYRLGLYGMLCLPEQGYSNEGIKDVIFALKWIKSNIKNFGGDDTNILLFGHSSGSTLVDLILLYNEQNVFNKVILQSAQAVMPYLVATPANDTYVRKIATRLNIDAKNSKIEDILAEISGLDASVIINVTKDDIFRPCVDNKLIYKTPRRLDMSNVTILVGTTTEEILYFYKGSNTYLAEFKKDLFKPFTDLPEQALNDVLEFYLQGDIKKIVDAASDFVFNYPVERSIRFYLKSNATVYQYIFSYDGGRNFMKIRDDINEVGVAHGDELGYIYDIEILGDNISEDDQRVIDVVTGLWTNFAKSGNPTPEISDVITTIWPTVNEDSKYYLDIGSTLSVHQRLYEDRMKFWDGFYTTYGNKSRGFNFGEEYTREEGTNL